MDPKVSAPEAKLRRVDRVLPTPKIVRTPQDLAGGFVLLAPVALGLRLTQDLDQGTLNVIAPAMLPRWPIIATLLHYIRQGRDETFTH
jgi:hypothetical protein